MNIMVVLMLVTILVVMMAVVEAILVLGVAGGGEVVEDEMTTIWIHAQNHVLWFEYQPQVSGIACIKWET